MMYGFWRSSWLFFADSRLVRRSGGRPADITDLVAASIALYFHPGALDPGALAVPTNS